jgi:thioredoxin reductase (NADPH)
LATSKPTLLAVDDDPVVSRAVVRDLRARYGADYRVIGAGSGAEGLELLKELTLRDRSVALVASDQRMPEMTGIEMLAEVRRLSPDTKLLLLTAYADTDVAIKAINDIALDYYMFKPWDPPDERLYPVVDGLLDDWMDAHPPETSQVRVLGHRWSERSYELKTFLARNHVPYKWLDVERDDEARRLLGVAGRTAEDLPLVLVPDGESLAAPSTRQLAEALGLRTQAQQNLYDLCIVGAGPAGLAAAVYAASEGLSGADLTHRAVAQAARFGAETVLASDVTSFEERGPVRAVLLEDGGAIESRALLVATGVSYRRLDAPGVEELGLRGVYYGASAGEAVQCEGEDVYVVGAANSAGQAVLNFARYAKRVVLLVRGSGLEASMSQYLVDRIRAMPNVEVRLRTEVAAATGAGHLETLTLADRDSGAEEEVSTGWLFVFIGASPRTDWLGDQVARDPKGFVLTGQELLASPAGKHWPLPRSPYALETSVPGVFAAGDVRLDSMKRVASAVGEGAMSVYLVHRYLATI